MTRKLTGVTATIFVLGVTAAVLAAGRRAPSLRPGEIGVDGRVYGIIDALASHGDHSTMATTSTIAPAEALQLTELIAPAPHGIASRILSKNNGGSLTLFAFDAGQGLSEHTAPFDAIVIVLDGHLSLTIGGIPVTAAAGSIVRMPANVPHAVDAPEPSRMLLTMLREPKAT